MVAPGWEDRSQKREEQSGEESPCKHPPGYRRRVAGKRARSELWRRRHVGIVTRWRLKKVARIPDGITDYEIRDPLFSQHIENKAQQERKTDCSRGGGF